jgi:hypothetical protein
MMGEKKDIEMVAAFVEIAKLAAAYNLPPLNELPNVWECKVDEHWTIVVNGHKEKKQWHDIEIAPFHCYVEFNGFPAGIFSPRGGSIAAGELANEETFINAVRVKTIQVQFGKGKEETKQ